MMCLKKQKYYRSVCQHLDVACLGVDELLPIRKVEEELQVGWRLLVFLRTPDPDLPRGEHSAEDLMHVTSDGVDVDQTELVLTATDLERRVARGHGALSDTQRVLDAWFGPLVDAPGQRDRHHRPEDVKDLHRV